MLFLIILFAVFSTSAIAQCYYPDGKQSDGLFPCNTTAAASHCCRNGDVCITNGFCFSFGLNAIVRRGCTDKTWNSTECPRQCTIGEAFKSSDVVLTPCDRYTTFCCGQNQAARNCCNTDNGTVNVIAGAAMLPSATVTLSPTPTSKPQECPTNDCRPPKIAAIVLGAALGCVSLFAGYLLYRRRQIFE